MEGAFKELKDFFGRKYPLWWGSPSRRISSC